ncbi:MAG: AAA family ATPase [Chloroflexi bacterium]|nr:GAF domain-containing protein [Chloroflexota bacterium]NOG34759.1 AAA family ATPase [Chloroflexota bacterium]
MTPPGYTITDKLYESSHTAVYRAQSDTGQPVILKVLQPAQATPQGLARFQREYEITRQLTGDGMIQVYALESFPNSQAIVVEDFGGQSLARLANKPLPLDTFLPLALHITDQLDAIHQQNLIHKDINPANIIWNPETGVVKIIDFGLSTSLSRENPEIRSPRILEGTLAYISPEQTGRMNRAMDYRADYYSLGAAFYQLLTGQPPFTAQDPIELVHAHIARPPQPPHTLNTAVPAPLGDIILRLLAKNAEDRYQSAYGLKADLQECWQQWQTHGRITPFPLAQHDISARFQLPQKLYGREAELQTLLAAFSRTAAPAQGHVELLLVTGAAGVGKSSLVRELHRATTIQRGAFISGKFDQLHHTPYAALIHAFQELVNQLLSENEARIAAWRSQLLTALGGNGQVIIDVIPAVEWIIGPQPTPPPLPPSEAEARFTLAFQNFIRVFAQADHPLVLFLDDWQWMDAGSRQLLQRLISAPHTRHLLLIGAYRDAEVGQTHPVWQMVNNLRQSGIPVSDIALTPLTLPVINQYVADALHTTPDETRLLAELVLAKTGGNPFFTGEFLKSLVAANLITFDYETGRWRWDLPGIQATDITDNVVELITGHIQQLSAAEQTVLKLAACIGARFDLATLALVYNQSAQDTAVALWESIVAGLITPLNDEYRLAIFDVPTNAAYKFAHDRIQQAAYALLNEAEKQATHRQIGNYLLQAAGPDRPHDYAQGKHDTTIFTILNHLNLAQPLLKSQTEQDELAALNLAAGQKAMQSAAFLPALEYLHTGIRLLNGDTAWARCYDLALALHTQAAAAANLGGQYAEMGQWTGAVIRHGRTLLDKTPVYETIIQAQTHQNRLDEALDTAVAVLQQFGLKLPRHPSRRHLLPALLQTRRALRGKSPADLLTLPRMTDPEQLAITSILARAGVTAYFVSTELFALIVLHLAQRYVRYGNTPFACRAFATYGLILVSVLRDYDSGYAYCQMAIKLLDQLQAAEMTGSTHMVFNVFVRHWKEHLRETLPALQEAYQAALAAGDPEFATYCAYGYSKHALHVGENLAQLTPEMIRYSEVMAYYKKEKIHYVHNFYVQTAVNLSQPTPLPYLLQGEYFDESTTVPAYRAANDRSALCAFDIQKAMLCYLFGQPELGLPFSQEASELLARIPGSNSIPLFYLYDSLIRLALYPTFSPAEQKAALKKVAANQKKLAKLIPFAPVNFTHKQTLVAAELARVQGDPVAAADLYDQAIQQAITNQYPHEAALAMELAGNFHAAQEDGLAAFYHRQAYETYAAWGAVSKTAEMASRFPYLAPPERSGETISVIATTRTATMASTTVNSTAVLDLTSVIKASQAIASEIVLPRLTERLMRIVIENAGAQTGCLLLPPANSHGPEGGWQPAAWAGEGEVVLPLSLIQHVARSQTAVLLENASQSQFAQDPVIRSRRPQSVLCLPLLQQGNLAGLLYLENNLATGAFTANHLAVLNMLASQTAISLQNAQLYGRLESYNSALEEKVGQRTAELAQATQDAEAARAIAIQANEAKSAFLANMSHELRTPLNAIIGFTRIVRRRSSDALPDRQLHNLDRVLVSAEQLLSIINTILDIAKIEAGRMEVQAAQFNLATVVDLCVTAVQPSLKPGVTIIRELPADLPVIYSDQDKIRQILINLLGNAAKFTAHGRITIQAVPESDTLAITIQDTGIGIPADALPRIFEEFEQASPAIRQQYDGVGLGLALSRSLARLLGGRITAVSTPGLGSAFTLTIPVMHDG